MTSPLRCLSLRTEAPHGVSSQSKDPVYLLLVSLRDAADTTRQALSFDRESQLEWLGEAALSGASLAILSTPNAVELYSTQRSRIEAFRPALRAFRARTKHQPEVGQLRTVELCGKAAALHLLRRAAGLKGRLGDLQIAAEIHAAAALSANSAALGPALSSLFLAAGNVSRRVLQETELGDVTVANSVRELDRFAAERIAAEELCAWEAQRNEAQRSMQRRSLVPRESISRSVPASAPPSEYSEEPGSLIRVRAAARLPGVREA
ncbi:MAG TPA: hypothetical protein VFQ61_03930 [Polyangiaceae bacterium]|nr:hypothetical protein [Polyangiaceae bacterium]